MAPCAVGNEPLKSSHETGRANSANLILFTGILMDPGLNTVLWISCVSDFPVRMAWMDDTRLLFEDSWSATFLRFGDAAEQPESRCELMLLSGMEAAQMGHKTV